MQVESVSLFDGLSGIVPREEAHRRRPSAEGRLAFLSPEHDTVQAKEHPAFLSITLATSFPTTSFPTTSFERPARSSGGAEIRPEIRLRVQLQPVRMCVSQVRY